MKTKTVPPRQLQAFQPEDFISISAAITLLADRDRRSHDTDRARKQRMRDRIGQAVKAGHLPEAMRQGKKCYVYGRLVAWAQSKWPGIYGSLLPVEPIRASMMETGPRMSLVASAHSPPTALQACQAELAQTIRRVHELHAQVTVLQAELNQLRSDATRWQEYRRSNA